jgi:hypothetical protein
VCEKDVMDGVQARGVWWRQGREARGIIGCGGTQRASRNMQEGGREGRKGGEEGSHGTRRLGHLMVSPLTCSTSNPKTAPVVWIQWAFSIFSQVRNMPVALPKGSGRKESA